ncbi:MAG: hypothetical protein ACHBN1_24995 [Heteroscytonema crispum UTEX LB 1556]
MMGKPSFRIFLCACAVAFSSPSPDAALWAVASLLLHRRLRFGRRNERLCCMPQGYTATLRDRERYLTHFALM